MISDLAYFLKRAKGDEPCDLVLKNGAVVNVFTKELLYEDIAINGEYIVGIGNYKGIEEVDLNGKIVCPGFIDAHVHIESSFLIPQEFARAVASHGTCCVICDPHEIANVMGVKGIELMLNLSKGKGVDFFFMVPSCVPASSLETSGSTIGEKETEYLFNKYPDRIIGLGEVMNFPGVCNGEEVIINKILLSKNKVIDGHAPLLSGNELNAYIFAGPGSDHECTKRDEALEKVRKGMYIFIREGTTEKNLNELLSVVNQHNESRFCFATDDKHADEIYTTGHIDFMIKKAIKNGLDPLTAIKMATLNPATYFGLKRHGAIAPGYYADLVVVSNLMEFEIENVFLKGKRLSKKKENHGFNCSVDVNIVKLNFDPLSEDQLKVICKSKTMRVIKIIPDQILTETLILKPKIVDGLAISDQDRDVIKVAVIERHKNTKNMGLGFVTGLNLRNGAIATTVAHDSHNLLIAGTNDRDMMVAANCLREVGGGLVATSKGEVLNLLELPLAGLMSTEPLEVVVQKLNELDKTLKDSITPLGIKAYMYLSFLALPVIPSLRITDKGLVDVKAQSFVPLFV